MLFSTFSEDPIFEVIARGHAAVNGLWVSIALPVSAYELQCRTAYATEYTVAIDIRKLSGELMVERPPAQRSHRLHTVTLASLGGVRIRLMSGRLMDLLWRGRVG